MMVDLKISGIDPVTREVLMTSAFKSVGRRLAEGQTHSF